MELLNKNKDEKIIRIIIGTTKRGNKSIGKPTKTISLIKTDVLEVYKLIIKSIEKEQEMKK